MKEIVLVPADRVRILTADVRKEISSRLGVKLAVSGNAVEIEGEGLKLYIAKNIVKAIARGFSPARASRLFSEEVTLEIIDLGGLTERRLAVIKARIIGTKGRMRELIEKCSGAALSVYGKTIAIIGDNEQLSVAKTAINMIIGGAMHSTVRRYLERRS
jgi:ribosomal RNA assembly protein